MSTRKNNRNYDKTDDWDDNPLQSQVQPKNWKRTAKHCSGCGCTCKDPRAKDAEERKRFEIESLLKKLKFTTEEIQSITDRLTILFSRKN